jgi:hypothetical protein
MVTVKEGKFGISYDEGELTILSPGRHVWDKPTHSFCALLSAGQSTLQIQKVSAESADSGALPLIEFCTSYREF